MLCEEKGSDATGEEDSQCLLEASEKDTKSTHCDACTQANIKDRHKNSIKESARVRQNAALLSTRSFI